MDVTVEIIQGYHRRDYTKMSPKRLYKDDRVNNDDRIGIVDNVEILKMTLTRKSRHFYGL